jgi:hypothetical protein
MKKLSLLLGALTMVVLVSCKEKEEEPIEVAPVEVAPEATENEGTKIKVNADGVEYSDGNTEIEVSKDGGEVKKD